MAQILHRNVVDDWFATLDVAPDGSTTSIDLASSGATGSPDVPFYFNIDQEIIKCTAIAVDTPSSGKDRLTVVRGVASTSAASHLVTAVVEQSAFAIQITELQEKQEILEKTIVNSYGGSAVEGVVRTSDSTQLETVQQGTPDMTVKIKEGSSVVSGSISGILSDYTTPTITAPSGNPRKDIVQINQENSVTVKTGAEGSSPAAPAVDTDNLLLATIDLAVSQSSITTSDITDGRVYI